MNINLSIFFDLVLNDFRSRYLNNYLGGIWAFVQPIVTILIYWFVFTIGFRSPPVGDVPYVLWIITGMIPWFFLSEGILSATNAIIEKDFLVKKIFFTVEILPAVKIATAFAIQIVFILLMLAIFTLYNFTAQWSWLQLLYYLLCAVPLMLGITWITSSVIVFFRDLGHIVAMIIQFAFWLTPIVWPIKMVSPSYRWAFEINPFYYIVDGYRTCMISNVWFWEKPVAAFLYWGITLAILTIGWILFRRLRPHFADVL